MTAAGDRGIFERAIAAERPDFQPPRGVTGITVPHHLLAADLIARGFWAASANDYDRVILLSPDHFRAVHGRFATTRDDVGTVFGAIETDTAAVDRLLADPALFEEVNLAHEHGIHSVAPFVRHFFPHARIVPVVASVSTTSKDWERAVEALGPLVTERTLVVQSTDYSHYRSLGEAIRRDQESIGIIAAQNPSAVARLLQPTHLDSRAAQFIQLRLQAAEGARPVVIANRNSADYAGSKSSTTSYVVTAFLRDPAAGSVLAYDDQTMVYFGGDVLLGRFLTPILSDEDALRSIANTVHAITRGAPLIVNLEGVILDQPVIGGGGQSHLMQKDLAGPILRRLGIVAAGLANNHSHDFGQLGFSETRRHLDRLGIRPLVAGQVVDFGDFRLVALTFVPGKELLGKPPQPPDARFVCDLAGDPPLIAFVHWGEEYTNVAGEEERNLASQLADCGVSAVIGGHSHQAAQEVEAVAGGALQSVYSVGNFLFDQSMPQSSGALVEARVFRQGTIAIRLVPIPNLFLSGRLTLEASAHDRGLK